MRTSDGSVNGLVRHGLALHVDRRADRESTAVEHRETVAAVVPPRLVREELVDDVVAEVRRVAGRSAAGGRARDVEHVRDRGRDRLVVLVLGDVLQPQHVVENEVAPHLGVVRVVDRVPPRGRLRDARQQCGLRDRQFGGGVVEVVLGGRLDAVHGRPELGDVEVPGEDLLLGLLLLERDRQARLLELASDRLLSGALDGVLVAGLTGLLDAQVLHVLLRERRRAGERSAGQVVDRGARDALDVDAVVVVEPLVLDGHHRVHHVDVDRVRRDDDAVLRVERGEHGAVGGEDRGALRRLREREVRGEVVEQAGPGARHLTRGGHGRHHESCAEESAHGRDQHERQQQDDRLIDAQGAPLRGGWRRHVHQRTQAPAGFAATLATAMGNTVRC
jgi:hypothetical protein